MTLPDHAIRQQALDTQRSFIIQAPAGSGKTELLIQRYLALLACVEQAPEEIIAITFTRKAAAEMRQRIIDALQAAGRPTPQQPHAQQTWQLAQAALLRDQQSQWRLLENPHRLRVQTIDSLCANFARRAPLLSGLGTGYRMLENNVADYYREAVRRLLARLEDSAWEDLTWEDSTSPPALAHLLLHLDNRLDVVENLLLSLLARRDQWLPHLMVRHHYLHANEFRRALESGLQHIVEDSLHACANAIPKSYHAELMTLLQYASANLSAGNIDSSINDSIAKHTSLPQPSVENISIWRALANLLLTREHTWRLMVDKKTGFPTTDKSMKQRMLTLLAQLKTSEPLRQRLAAVANAPPIAYTESQWRILAALTEVLPQLVAELNVLFRERNVADFTDIAIAASAALGEKDAPTDLTLLLDAQIRHLLVDEFQDTSTTQFHLLEKLTSEWQPNDGRTLFLVGDPMQSIYRFREAEVGLFLKAQQEGLGNLALESLILQTNFRSIPQVVDWINTHFSALFPEQVDISSGAVTFSPSIATHAAQPDSGVFLHPFAMEESVTVVNKIIDIIQTEQASNPAQEIAVLVRSRSHLTQIIPALNQAGLAFNAVDIDSLATQPMVQDLIALTSALLHIGDRLCWLAILRAPWCGLLLSDLLAIATYQSNRKPLWDTLLQYENIADLSADAKQRLAVVMPILQHSIAQRGRLSLRSAIETAWLALQGPACALNLQDLHSAQAYFAILDSFDQAGKIPDYAELNQVVNKQYTAAPTTATNSAGRLHVMTIHKAKGLEFDTVIIPELQLKSRSDTAQLLLWLDRPRIAQANDLILAPIKASIDEHDPIYTHLQQVEKTKSGYELARLLYVAATRAKKNLHLVAKTSVNNAVIPPSAGSFLKLLWPAFHPVTLEKLTAATPMAATSADVPDNPLLLRRLILPEKTSTEEIVPPATESLAPVQTAAVDTLPTTLGTIIHSILQSISRDGLSIWTAEYLAQQSRRWQTLLLQAGISPDLRAEYVATMQRIVTRTLDDPRGRWILSPHLEHRSEYALTALIDNKPMRMVIDRTFVDEQQQRWIIDYKITLNANTDHADFLAQAAHQHRAQLEAYAQAMQALDARSIRLGLYFPTFAGWYEWEYSLRSTSPCSSVNRTIF